MVMNKQRVFILLICVIGSVSSLIPSSYEIIFSPIGLLFNFILLSLWFLIAGIITLIGDSSKKMNIWHICLVGVCTLVPTFIYLRELSYTWLKMWSSYTVGPYLVVISGSVIIIYTILELFNNWKNNSSSSRKK